MFSYHNTLVLHNSLQLECFEPFVSDIPLPGLLLPMVYGGIHFILMEACGAKSQ